MIALSDSNFEDPHVPVPVCFSALLSAFLCLFCIPGGQPLCTRAPLPAGFWAASASGRRRGKAGGSPFFFLSPPCFGSSNCLAPWQQLLLSSPFLIACSSLWVRVILFAPCLFSTRGALVRSLSSVTPLCEVPSVKVFLFTLSRAVSAACQILMATLNMCNHNWIQW